MQIIPVIDLKNGQVVHAVRGERQHYQPIHLNSLLTTSSDLEAVLSGFLNLHTFKTFYIADLNAITHNNNHDELIMDLVKRHPDLTFWIDNGSQYAELCKPRPNNYHLVIGTESQTQTPDTNSPLKTSNFILSLDYKQHQACGDSAWFNNSALWPSEIIVMSLNRVGSYEGPDLAKLTEFSAAYPDKHFIAAGGIRHINDLIYLKALGIKAALLATSLHSGAISSFDIANF